MTIEALYQIYQRYPSIQTDTRKLKAGDLYFALKGPNFNGNQFAGEALQKGASYVILDERQPPDQEDRYIYVEDVLDCLQQLALHHRRQLNIPFLAITGSNGKTTTKELVHAVLSTTYKTYTTEGNLNNHIGIPLTILKVRPDAEIAVVEMGANHQQEIAGYCRYTLPTHGLITNVGKAHLEGFGGPEGVRRGKGELFDHLRSSGGTAFVMWDYDYLREMSRGIPQVFRYGTREADIQGAVCQSEPFLEIEVTQGMPVQRIQTQLVGDYNFPNLLAAIAVGKYFKVNDPDIKAALEAYAPSNSRSQLLIRDSNHIILDAYNANPSSMKLAVENFARLKAGKKILLLGGMAELGAESLQEHKNLIETISQYPWEAVALVGGDFQKLPHSYHRFDNALQAKEWLVHQNFENAYLLIKGSRSMQMEKLIS